MSLKSNRQSFYLGGSFRGPQFCAPTNISKSRTSDLCDWTENNTLQPMRQLVELMNLINQYRTNNLGGNLQNVPQGFKILDRKSLQILLSSSFPNFAVNSTTCLRNPLTFYQQSIF